MGNSFGNLIMIGTSLRLWSLTCCWICLRGETLRFDLVRHSKNFSKFSLTLLWGFFWKSLARIGFLSIKLDAQPIVATFESLLCFCQVFSFKKSLYDVRNFSIYHPVVKAVEMVQEFRLYILKFWLIQLKEKSNLSRFFSDILYELSLTWNWISRTFPLSYCNLIDTETEILFYFTQTSRKYFSVSYNEPAAKMFAFIGIVLVTK